MAANTRTAIKWIRDLAKSHYNKGSCCEICGVEHDLEFHHYNTVSLVLKNYAKERNIGISTKEEILAMRENFIKEMWHEIVVDAVTLCSDHHKLLHKLYGKEPPLTTAEKQRQWVIAQHEKRANGARPERMAPLPASLTRFCTDSKPLTKFLTR